LDTRTGSVTIGDRTLGFVEGGDPDGFPVFHHHGTPSSGMLYLTWLEDAAEKGIRLIAHSRPGYGDSTRQPGRSVAAVAVDVAAIADHLGVDRFATWGMSGGGPHSLACAALLPERVAAAAALASIAPWDAEGLDVTAGMGEDNVEEFAAAARGEDALRPMLEEFRPMVLKGTPEGLIEMLNTVLSPVDREILSGDIAAFMVEQSTFALRSGIDGWLDDDLAFTKPWEFDLADISVRVLLTQGRHDLMVPFSHGEWLAAAIPGVDARLSEEDGHLTVAFERTPKIHEWLLQHAGV
jgi:pimeloyl-ACP methyl ester carboxylesterase